MNATTGRSFFVHERGSGSVFRRRELRSSGVAPSFSPPNTDLAHVCFFCVARASQRPLVRPPLVAGPFLTAVWYLLAQAAALHVHSQPATVQSFLVVPLSAVEVLPSRGRFRAIAKIQARGMSRGRSARARTLCGEQNL
jgi:hypothetical protein